MAVVENISLEEFSLPGIVHRTIAGAQHGLKGIEVWMQTIEPGAATPMHSHDCEEVVVILRGSGHFTIEGEENPFGPNSTLVIPPEAVHQVANSGNEEMFLIAAFSATPANSYAPDGEMIALPWQA